MELEMGLELELERETLRAPRCVERNGPLPLVSIFPFANGTVTHTPGKTPGSPPLPQQLVSSHLICTSSLLTQP